MMWSDVTGCEVGEEPTGWQGDPEEASKSIQGGGGGGYTRVGRAGFWGAGVGGEREPADRLWSVSYTEQSRRRPSLLAGARRSGC